MKDDNVLMDLIGQVIFWMGKIPMLPVAILISLVSFFIGIFVASKPGAAIELQRKFYAKINWKIEPISMQKELGNTRIMGCFMVAFAIAALVFSLANKSLFTPK